MLYLVSFNEQKYTRRLESFQAETLQYVIEFDASLTGAGVLWYQRLEDGSEVSIGGAAVDLRGFAFGTDSSFQNTAEFIGCILGLLGLFNPRSEECRRGSSGGQHSGTDMGGDRKTEGTRRDKRVHGLHTVVHLLWSRCEEGGPHPRGGELAM